MRPLRVEYEGAVYHVMARGQERGTIFRDDGDRNMFLEDLEGIVRDQRWVIHGYCLMTNHYHLLVETPLANLSVGMHLLNGRYSQAYNLGNARRGHLFEDRFKAIVVEKEAYLLELCRYVVLNPVRAGMVPSAGDYRWSNYRATAGEATEPGFLTVAWTLGQFGNGTDTAQIGYRRFVAAGKGAASPLDEATGQVFLGGPGFIAEMRRRLGAEAAEPSKAIPRIQRAAGFFRLEDVLAVVSGEYGLSAEQLTTAWRRGEERAVALYLARRLTGLSGVKLGERFGVTGVRVSQLVSEVERSPDAALRRRVQGLEARIRETTGSNGPGTLSGYGEVSRATSGNRSGSLTEATERSTSRSGQ